MFDAHAAHIPIVQMGTPEDTHHVPTDRNRKLSTARTAPGLNVKVPAPGYQLMGTLYRIDIHLGYPLSLLT